MESKWDLLAEYFSEPNASSSDNVEIVEPVLIEELKRADNLRIIDFGCGSGNFCRRIAGFSCKVLGIDSSEKMIEVAKKKNSARNICYTTRPVFDIDIGEFNVFNAEFVIQFLTDRELLRLVDYLRKSNIVWVLISNERPEFIERCLSENRGNYAMDGNQYTINLDGNRINLFPRSVDVLSEIFQRGGFELKLKRELKFPEFFLKKFPEARKKPTDLAAYCVLLFERAQGTNTKSFNI